MPTRRLLWFCLAGAPFAALGVWLGLDLYVFWCYNALLIAASAVDLLLLPKRSQIRVERRMPERADIGQPIRVELYLEADSNQALRLEMTDDVPVQFEQPGRLTAVMDSRGTQADYTTSALERGRYTFRQVYLRYSGLIGLWQKQVLLPAEQELRIYPDLSGVRGVLASTAQMLLLDGRKVIRRSTSGTEFQNIREYVQGDDPRYMNWAASARTGTLMTNIYQPERGKFVTILIDCGRMMGVELDNRVKLDRTLEAGLTLAAVALKQGDQVAVLAFSNEIKCYVPPGKGMGHLQTIVDTVFDLKSDFVESDYSRALEYLARLQKKRSLLVLLSDMDNYLLEERLVPYLLRLRRNHLIVLLALQDPVLHGWARCEAEDRHDFYAKSVAQKQVLDRRSYVRRMAGFGIHVLDVAAGELPLAAVNFYLDVKAREAL
ncbi:DUF58 domain-containing protein [Paenibacillus sp. y28]|uniref:DUF58 domain-containing protein n=1 Tax=Paenibacillus sp. y28 TaxID=3129110 RepID=UPI00301AC6F1